LVAGDQTAARRRRVAAEACVAMAMCVRVRCFFSRRRTTE
jgi:hypothetical protein